MFLHSLLASLGAFALMSNAALLPLPRTTGNPSDVQTLGQTVYEFENGTWVENIAARANGNLLVTLVDRPELYEISPRKHSARLVHRFDGYTSLLGISETSQDVFAVAVGNFSLTRGTTPKTFSIWKVDLSNKQQGKTTHVSKVTDMPDAIFLNGMTTLQPGSNSILVSDCTQGVVYRVNVETGKYAIVLRDETFLPTADAPFPIGINGIRLHGNYLYYSNTPKELFGRIPINTLSGEATGGYKVIHLGFEVDDFAIRNRAAYAAAGVINEVFRIGPDWESMLVAGAVNSTLVEGATSAVFGRTWSDKDILYVTTSGGQASILDGITTEGGKVVALHIDC
ncbi:hypothetical protein NQ176_g883 [Zarea fungicola]|uniref:Uncharacterized protein n=1 Tax=Zarea fungicola TaxID=93591 RepID=A0ACC1NXL7_9HYPO|nr:hypothetical protein NQ176_g883 [Lecanicillium fungicola]